MQTVTKTVLLVARETIDPRVMIAPPEPANKAEISPLMQRVMRNMELAELVENHELA